MTMPDLTQLDDDGLEALLNGCLNEQERRRRRDVAPQQIAELAERFIADGGDPSDLPDLGAMTT